MMEKLRTAVRKQAAEVGKFGGEAITGSHLPNIVRQITNELNKSESPVLNPRSIMEQVQAIEEKNIQIAKDKALEEENQRYRPLKKWWP